MNRSILYDCIVNNIIHDSLSKGLDISEEFAHDMAGKISKSLNFQILKKYGFSSQEIEKIEEETINDYNNIISEEA